VASALKAIRSARAAARQRVWALAGDAAPGCGGGLITADIDATIVTSCSEKEQARPTWKKTYGFHPLTVFADHCSDGSGEPLAIMLRPGNAGSNTAADHITAAKLALAQMPKQVRRRVLIRADSGGGTHEFLNWLTRPGQRLAYSVGFTITDDIAEAIGKIPAAAWTPAYDAAGGHRHAEPVLLAQGHAADRAERTTAPRRATAVHRHRRAPSYLLRHRRPHRAAR
jgi:hypothetical protein